MDVVITRVGAQGDGMAMSDGAPLFVPFTLAGERVRVSRNGDRTRVEAVLEASSDRVAPVCQHFGRCGGCALQHMAPALYASWKREQVIAAFKSRGIEADVAPLVVPDGLRRRAVFTARRSDDGIQIGFH